MLGVALIESTPHTKFIVIETKQSGNTSLVDRILFLTSLIKLYYS